MSTVLAGFDSHEALAAAVDQLLAHGFPRGSIHYQAETQFREMPSVLSQDPGMMARLGSFFQSLTKSADQSRAGARAGARAGVFDDLIQRGGVALSVQADTSIERATAQMLMRKAGGMGAEEFEQSRPTHVAAADESLGSAANAEFEAASSRDINVGGLTVLNKSTNLPGACSESLGARSPDLAVAATDLDFGHFREATLEVRERVEQAIVTKNARVIEEIVIGKTVSLSTDTVTDTVRRGVVEVERITVADSV